MSDPADEQTTTTTELPPETTTTEAAPLETTTGEAAPSGTTTAGGTTTTLAPPGDGPAFSEISVAIDPDDGQDQHSKSIEISTDAALILSWSTNKATAVRIEGVGEFPSSGSTRLESKDASYSLIAADDGGNESSPYLLEVHAHAPGQVVSGHVDIFSGVTKIISFTATVDGQPVQTAAPGSTVTLTVIVTPDADSVTAGGEDVPLADTGDGHLSGSVEVSVPDDDSGTQSFEAVASKDGNDADTNSLAISVTQAGGGTTAAPSSTTAAPSSSTTGVPIAITAFQGSYAGKGGAVQLSSGAGSFKDPANDKLKKTTQQHFPAAGTGLTLSWTIAGHENARVDLKIDQLSSLPKGETRASSDFFTGLTTDGSGTVDYLYTLPPGRVTLWIDLSISDASGKPIETRSIIAFTDSGLPAIDSLAISAGEHGEVFCDWKVVRAPSSNVWLVMRDEPGAQIGDPVQLRNVKANAAAAGRTRLPIDSTKFPGQKLSFSAAIFMVADGTGAANAPPFNIAAEGRVIGTPSPATLQAGGGAPSIQGARDRDFYIRQSFQKAFGSPTKPDWDPKLGYKHNRATIIQLYDYYRRVYNADPNTFLWAGLGRMAGGAVVGGLDTAVGVPTGNAVDVSFLGKKMVEIGKAIFLDIAWQHEAFQDNTNLNGVNGIDNAFALVKQRDAEQPIPKNSYEQAWKKIVNGSDADIAAGNQMLLENEQFTIIQPRYDEIKASTDGSAETFERTSAFTGNVHPYHLDFITAMPGKDVSVFADRWAWITQEPHGMWAKWAERHRGQWGSVEKMPLDYRNKLVNLDFDKIIQQRWPTPLIQDLLPPGAP